MNSMHVDLFEEQKIFTSQMCVYMCAEIEYEVMLNMWTHLIKQKWINWDYGTKFSFFPDQFRLLFAITSSQTILWKIDQQPFHSSQSVGA